LDSFSKASLSDVKLFNKTFIDKILNEHFSSEVDHSYRIWGLMVLLQWQKTFNVKGM
jgi:hypothetical protein